MSYKQEAECEQTCKNVGSTQSEEMNACVPVVTNQIEQEVGDVSDVARQKRHVISGNTRMMRSAMCYPNEDIEKHN